MHTLLDKTEPGTADQEGRGTPVTVQPKRDLLSRRLSSEIRRRLARIGALLVADSLTVTLGLFVGHEVAAMLGLNAGLFWHAHLAEVIVLAVLGQAVAGTYGPVRRPRMGERVALGLVLALAGVAIIGAADGHVHLSWIAGLVLGLFLAGALAANRWVLGRIVSALYRRNVGVKNTLIVGGERESWQLAQRFRISHEEFNVVGHLRPDGENDPTAMGGLSDLHEILEEYDIRTVVVSARIPQARFRELVAKCFSHGAAVSVVPATLSEISARVSSMNLLGWPLVELEVPRLHMIQVITKRLMDLVGSTLGMILLSPLYLATAVAVRLESPGPILFRQERVGLGGETFTVYKFRSMRPDAEELLKRDPVLYQKYVQNNYKLPPGEDPRISGLGRFLRRTSLDELPQLFNVVKGDMSLVGPRPVVPKEIEEYGDRARSFVTVKPGLTGYWQISGRSHVGYPERAEMDMHYIDRWSLALDIKILILTIPRLLRGAH